MQTSEQPQLLTHISNLIAPLDLQQFNQLLIANGFNAQGYLNTHQQLLPLGNDTEKLFLHFISEGIPHRLYFRPGLVNRDFLRIVNDLYNAPLSNTSYKSALVANFASSFLNQLLFHDYAVSGGTPREAADNFSNADLQAVLACEGYGALPYFVLGDSHSRLYQHHGLLCSHGWLLPISITCIGGSARGLANSNSRFKYGDRLRNFFQRIQPVVEQGIHCFFKFGQVDLEYLFNFKWSQENSNAFDENKFIAYGDESIRRYLGFLNSLVPPALRPKTFVCSISLPALADHVCKKTYLEGIFAFTPHSQQEVEKLRPTFENMEIPDIHTRSRLHMEFNQRLKVQAEQLGFPFANDAMLFWDERSKKINEVFTRQGGGRDVHIDRSETSLSLFSKFIDGLLKA